MRNLEQIQEQDEAPPVSRAVSLVLVALGVGAVVFAAVALGGRKTAASDKRPDPLGDLVAAHKGANLPSAPPAAALATQLTAKDVTFPSILSDDARPTTALAAVRTPSPTPSPAPIANAPPPAGDRLPVVAFAGGTPPVPHLDATPQPAPRDDVAAPPPPKASLPAQNVLEASPIVTRPRDPLTKTASDAADINTPPAASAPSGHDGGWQLQVSSFKTQAEAEQFADQLRARGHKAYTQEAKVAGRGTWWRVRVGPFSSKNAAQAYRASFEEKEHVVPFVVQPEKSADKH